MDDGETTLEELWIHYRTSDGTRLAVCADVWAWLPQPMEAVAHGSGFWRLRVAFTATSAVQFKYVLVDATARDVLRWEEGANRVLSCTREPHKWRSRPDAPLTYAHVTEFLSSGYPLFRNDSCAKPQRVVVAG